MHTADIARPHLCRFVRHRTQAESDLAENVSNGCAVDIGRILFIALSWEHAVLAVTKANILV